MANISAITSGKSLLFYIDDQSALNTTASEKNKLANLLGKKAAFFKRLAEIQQEIEWEAELQVLQAEQAHDLATPILTWWQSKPMTEAEYYNQLAAVRGFEVAA